MISIVYHNRKVNSFTIDFENLVKQENDKQKKSTLLFSTQSLNQLVPQIHKNYVRYIIDKFYQGDEEKYCEDVKLFFSKFTKQDKQVCDDSIVKDKTTKQLYKKKRKLILYSAQLLKLISRHRSKYITNDMLNIYKRDMLERDDYLANSRLIDNKGKIFKLKSLTQKQKEQRAQILKTSKLLDLIADEKGFTYSFITLTLPGKYHPFPLQSHNSYDGATPDDAINLLNNYWQIFRATLSQDGLRYGEDVLGISVIESQQDSTLHKHILIYHSISNTEKIKQATQTVQDNYKKKTGIQVNFDYRTKDLTLENPASGSTYVFKYITKTNSNYLDQENGKATNAVKNMAIRYFYGIRGYNVFGIKQVISKLNYLVKNIDRFKQCFDEYNIEKQHNSNYQEMIKRLTDISKKARIVVDPEKSPLNQLFSLIKQGDVYSFYRYFEKYFDNIYSGKLFIGVEFNKSSFEKDFCFSQKYSAEKILLGKRQYCLFEKNYIEEQEKIDFSNFEKVEFSNQFNAFDMAINKQLEIDLAIEEYITSQTDSFYLNENNELLHLYNIIQAKTALASTVLRKVDQFSIP